MFEGLTVSFKSAINKIRFADDEASLKKALDTLKKSLLKADVHHKIVKELLKLVEADVKAKGIGQTNFINSLKENLFSMLSVEGAKSGFVFSSKPPTKILMAGLQGSGKTTTTIKLASNLKSKGKKVLVVACDLQRLAAIEQLKQLCEQNEIDLYYEESEQDLTKIIKNALKKAQKEVYDVVITDTAGRLAIDEELMLELKEVKETLIPDDVLYVADSLSGQDGIKSAGAFNEQIGLDGVILSKYDGDGKGGVALGVAHQLAIPLRFIGTGEKITDIETFIPNRIVSRLMGEGDLETLAEKTGAIIDEKQAKNLNKKLKKGEFNFNDFLEQMEQMSKLGSMKSLIGMVPGMAGMADKIKDIDFDNSAEVKKIKAMIGSMTKKERETPSLLNNTRKRRIAVGSGLSLVEVNRFFKQFKNASKMAKKFSGKNGMRDLQNMMMGGQNRFGR